MVFFRLQDFDLSPLLRLRSFNFGLEGFSRLASRRYHVSKKEKKEKEKAGEKLGESREDFDFF